MARPSRYTPKLGALIAGRVAEGHGLKTIAEDKKLPSLRTMLEWSGMHPEFDRMLAHARLDKAAILMEQTVDISDEPVADMAQATRNRSRIQARQYMAARLDPRKWAEKIGIAIGTAPDPEGAGADVDAMLRTKFDVARRIAYALQRGKDAADELARRNPPPPLQLVHEVSKDAA